VQAIAAEIGLAVEAAEVGRARAEHGQRLEDLDRQKDGFLSTVSHELRTPLTSINGYLELLGDGDAGRLSEEQARMLAVIERNAVRLRGLIEDLLLINRMRDGVTGEVEAVDLDRLVAHAAEEMAPLAGAKGRHPRHRLDDRGSRRRGPGATGAGAHQPVVECREVHPGRRPGPGADAASDRQRFGAHRLLGRGHGHSRGRAEQAVHPVLPGEQRHQGGGPRHRGSASSW
jgi:signal transduction histidine kinase